MPTLNWPSKHPDDDLPYKLDWTDAMEDQTTITDSDWTIPAGLTSHDPTIEGKSTLIWLSGGDDGSVYIITNKVTLATEPWVMNQEVRIKVHS